MKMTNKDYLTPPPPLTNPLPYAIASSVPHQLVVTPATGNTSEPSPSLLRVLHLSLTLPHGKN